MPLNKTKNWGGRYKYKGFLFDWHDWPGPYKLRKDGTLAKRTGIKFYKMLESWLNLSEHQREKTRFDV